MSIQGEREPVICPMTQNSCPAIGECLGLELRRVVISQVETRTGEPLPDAVLGGIESADCVILATQNLQVMAIRENGRQVGTPAEMARRLLAQAAEDMHYAGWYYKGIK